MKKFQLLIILVGCCLISSTIYAQQYIELKQDGYVYDVDVIVFARQLSQPAAESINNAQWLKTEDAQVLPSWDRELTLLQFPEIQTPPSDSVPIENHANPVNVLIDVILTNSMQHPIINRLAANPTYKPLYRQKWRQIPSAFLQPKYIEISNLSKPTTTDQINLNRADISEVDHLSDYSIDGQVAFSKQRFIHLHVKMNLLRRNAENQPLIYKLSQQKRIELNEWQYFDHQQFGVLAKVTAIKLEKGE